MPPEPYTPSGISPNSVAIGGGGNANAPPSINTDDFNGGGGGGFHNNMGNGDGNGNGGGNGGNGDENYEEAESLMAQQPTKIRPPAKFFLGQPQKKKPSKCDSEECPLRQLIPNLLFHPKLVKFLFG